MRRAGRVLAAVGALLLLTTVGVQADVRVGTGSRLVVSDGAELDANCTAITVADGGSLELGDGRIAACGHFTLASGATFADGSGTLEFNGTWSNDSDFRKSSASTIYTIEACALTNNVIGSGDADGDGYSDGEEGFADINGNGIADFLEAGQTPGGGRSGGGGGGGGGCFIETIGFGKLN